MNRAALAVFGQGYAVQRVSVPNRLDGSPEVLNLLVLSERLELFVREKSERRFVFLLRLIHGGGLCDKFFT